MGSHGPTTRAVAAGTLTTFSRPKQRRDRGHGHACWVWLRNPICSPVEGQSPRLFAHLDRSHRCHHQLLGVQSTNNLSGVTAAMKNIYGMIDSPVRFQTIVNEYRSCPSFYASAANPQLDFPDHRRCARVRHRWRHRRSPRFLPQSNFLGTRPRPRSTSYALVLLNEIRAAMANAHPIAIQPICRSLTAWLATLQPRACGQHETTRWSGLTEKRVSSFVVFHMTGQWPPLRRGQGWVGHEKRG